MVRIIQANLQHSKVATDTLLQALNNNVMDIVLVQEPYQYEGRVLGLGTAYNIHYMRGLKKIRTCIIIRKNLRTVFVPSLSNADTTTVQWHYNEKDGSTKKVLLSSVYLPYEDDDPATTGFRKLCEEEPNTHKIVGCDCNAHNLLWNSTNTNERGKRLLEYLSTTNLLLLNKGNTPTFVTRTREEVLDITLATPIISAEITRWRVSDIPSLSDHRWISMVIQRVIKPPHRRIRNPRKTNWELYSQESKKELELIRNNEIDTEEKLNNTVNQLTEVLVKCYKKACPERTVRTGDKVLLTGRLMELRKAASLAHRKALQSKSDTDWHLCRSASALYKKEIRIEKRNNWRTLCESMTCSKDISSIRRLLSKDNRSTSLIQAEDGKWADSPEDCLKILVDKHFPNKSTDTNPISNVNRLPFVSEDLLDKITESERINWAINSFLPFKGTGADEIYPIMLQKADNILIEIISGIYKECIKKAIIPKEWTKARVIFMPKPGRFNHCRAEDFRPLSLTSFLLKTLERLVETHIRQSSDVGALCVSQHAYIGGRSTDTAAHVVVNRIEKAFVDKEDALIISLDIAGAFNNILTRAIILAMSDSGVDPALAAWLKTLLEDRIIIADFNEKKQMYRISGGTPQGGIASPLFWILAVNSIVKLLNSLGYGTIAYADDLLIILVGIDPSVLVDLAETALAHVDAWCQDSGLELNPKKTQVILFTRRRKMVLPRKVKVKGEALEYSSQINYLGLVLDSKLNWKANTEHRTQKATAAYFSFTAAFGKRWGLKPELVYNIYNTMVRPILCYGALVWGPSVAKNKTRMKTLARVQRLACIGITGALRTAPSAALELITGLMPIERHIMKVAMITAIRLKNTNNWGSTWWRGHAKDLEKEIISVGLRDSNTDYIKKSLTFEHNFRIVIPERDEWNSGPPTAENATHVYTDGSKMTSGVGAGVYSRQLNLEQWFRLDSHGTVFQAEILAIQKAAEAIRHLVEYNIVICVDSRAALMALDSNWTKSSLVDECRSAVNECATNNKVTLIWVPGHADIEGNEEADRLARLGSESTDARVTHVRRSMASTYETIDKFYWDKVSKEWSERTDCRISRAFWRGPNLPRSRRLIRLSRDRLSVATSIITGHCLTGTHAQRLGLTQDKSCRRCGVPDDTFQHMLCDCPYLDKIRHQYTGLARFADLQVASSIEIPDLIRFFVAARPEVV